MKKYFIITISVLLPLLAICNDSLSINAEKFYINKNYKAAIDCYESILSKNLNSFKLQYNLGNAYFKNNQLGKAIYHYQLAKKLDAKNQDVNVNLSVANAKTIDKIDAKENFFLSAIKTGLVNYFTTTGWAWLSIISLLLTLTLAFIFFIGKTPLIKRLTFFSSILFLILFISSMILGYSALHIKQTKSFAIILDREVKITEEPISSSKSKFNLHEGTQVSVLESNETWTNIKLENGNEGWVETKRIGLF